MRSAIQPNYRRAWNAWSFPRSINQCRSVPPTRSGNGIRLRKFPNRTRTRILELRQESGCFSGAFNSGRRCALFTLILGFFDLRGYDRTRRPRSAQPIRRQMRHARKAPPRPRDRRVEVRCRNSRARPISRRRSPYSGWSVCRSRRLRRDRYRPEAAGEQAQEAC